MKDHYRLKPLPVNALKFNQPALLKFKEFKKYIAFSNEMSFQLASGRGTGLTVSLDSARGLKYV